MGLAGEHSTAELGRPWGSDVWQLGLCNPIVRVLQPRMGEVL